MPPELEGKRRLPGPERFSFINGFRQWFIRQSVIRRIGLGAALYLVLALTAYTAFGSNACAVTADGRIIAVAADENSARGALGELVKAKSGTAGRPITVLEKVSFQGIRTEQADVLEKEALLSRLEQSLTFKAKSTAVVVNGEAKIFLEQPQDADTLLDWLKTVYPVEPGEQLQFKENVEVAELPADAERIMDLEAAKKLVLLGTTRVQQYTVEDGDNLWDIARAAKLDFDQVVLSNPGMDPERLSIGQIINLSKESPLITVAATREVTLNEEVPYPVETKKDEKLLLGENKVTQKGVPGERTVTYRITRENGLETEREVLSENIVKEATTEVVVKGSLTMVASRGGSVRLGWPCSGGISSNFGMRNGRMHEGVDIAASYGSSVAAAAGGMVISAGWDGGYGKCIQISHGDGLVTRYAHLSSMKVSVGQKVERGQLIGLVGSTGRSTGPHLHYEVIINGQPRNPLNYR